MGYQVSKTIIKKKKYKELYTYFNNNCINSKNLYNAALYRLRQNFTAYNKTSLSDNEQEVLNEINKTIFKTGLSQPGLIMSYKFLEKLMRVTKNPDFFTNLPMQSAQLILKTACADMKGWIESLKKYKKNPANYTGKPQIPKYKKSDLSMVKFTNQDCIIYYEDNKTYLKFPKTKEIILLPHVNKNVTLKEVQVKPYYDNFLVITIFETNKINTNTNDLVYSCGIDFGVNNTVALVSNNNSCLLYKGGAIKSANQWYNKQRSKYISILDKENQFRNTHRLSSLSKNRDCFIKDYFHKISSDIISYCLKNKIGTIIIGKNKGWKQKSNIGKTNNQNFVLIPFAILQLMIKYKAEQVGIIIIEQEESYTSKASFLDNDYMPTLNNKEEHSFSGKRISRGLYKSSDGTIINSDLNGAANILRKAIPNAFDNIKDYSFIQNKIEVKRFYDLHTSKKQIA